MPKLKQNKRKALDKLLTSIGALIVIFLVVVGSLAWWAYSFTSNNVKSELASQKIYFPPKGSQALSSPEIGPYLDKYAGQQLLTGPEAKAYANHFIAVHLSEVANGQTYSQVSQEALANPSNQVLKAEAQTLFQGETLRGLLLGDAYAFWTVGHIAQVAAIACFIAAGVMLVLVLLGLWHLSTF